MAQDNSLSSVTGLSKLTGLRKLDLARNCLTSLGQLSALHSLAHLSIEGNRLTSLAGALCKQNRNCRSLRSPLTRPWVMSPEVAAQLQTGCQELAAAGNLWCACQWCLPG